MDNNTQNDWYQIKVTGKSAQLDNLCAVMGMINSAMMIEDTSDLDEQILNGVYGDLIDEEVLASDRTVASVSVFVPASQPYSEAVSFAKQRFAELDMDVSFSIDGVREEDWANSWKKYYKPIVIGTRLVIVPAWEFDEYKRSHDGGAALVSLDPGMAFGTGTHETTRLCATLLAKYSKPSDRVLDVGCGSGILAIAAAKMGVKSAFACDIDPIAVRIARENAAVNEVSNTVTVAVSDLLTSAPKVDGGYDIVCANIVADIIIRLSPDVGDFMAQNGILVASGIIGSRENDVRKALGEAGIEVSEVMRENDWVALVCCKQ